MMQMKLMHDEDNAAITNANGDYSGAGEKRFVLVGEDQQWLRVHKLVLTIQDTDSDYNKYGDLTALSNGVQFQIEKKKPSGDPIVLQQLFSGLAIKKTEDMHITGGEIRPLNDGAGATRSTQLEIAFDKPLDIYTRHFQRLAMYMNDDLQGLLIHNCTAYYEQSPYG